MDDIAQIEEVMLALNPQDLVSILLEKFAIERMNRFFTQEPHHFPPGKVLELDSSTSLLLKFETLQKEFPEDYKDFLSYKLLLILNFRKAREAEFDVNLQNDLLAITRDHGINRIVIWSLTKIDPRMIPILKTCKTDLLHIDYLEVRDTRFISNFFPHPSNDYNYVVILNKVAELLIKRLKKLFHLVLSEIAAPIYNRRYGKAKVATNAVMDFEETVLQGLMQRLKKNSRCRLAVDIGCGTGRHSFFLAEVFQNVLGFDISPKMIKEANKAKHEREAKGQRHQVVFKVSDFEYEELMDEGDLQGKVDLMVLSFGMGSFIEDTIKMLKRCHDWLAPGGYVFFSFYNSTSIVLQMTPNWRDTSLSAHLDVEDNTLRVELTPDIIFQIYCKPFTNDVKSEIKGLFNIDKVYSYPTVMALLPNSVLENRLGRDLFSYVDLELTKRDRYNTLGHYTMIVAHKPTASLTGFANIMRILEAGNCEHMVLDHPPVFSIKDVLATMDLPKEAILKTVVFSYKEGREKKLVSVSIQADKRVNKIRLAQLLKTNPNILKFASEKQITSLGFPVGGIAPLGFREESAIRKFVDQGVDKIDEAWLYTGIGDNKKTLKISKECFLRTTRDYERIDVAESDPS
jgi:SAM-dependent methyltransferase/prolyl-tRNA editing enzyme YbaK/EbsC (Cys-tRNA(Pro) deacylase)